MSANHSIMKTIEISIIAFLMSLTFASCIKDIEFSGEQTESKLVMIGLQYVGGTPQLLVHHSLFFLDDSDDIKVNGLQVKLFVNDEFVEDLTVVDTVLTSGDFEFEKSTLAGRAADAYGLSMNYCSGEYVFQAGDRIRFEATSDDYDAVTAEIVMPVSPVIHSFDTVKLENIHRMPPYDPENPVLYPDVDEEGNPCMIYYFYDDSSYGSVPVYVYPGDISDAAIVFQLEIDDPSGVTCYDLKTDDDLLWFASNDPVFLFEMESGYISVFEGESGYSSSQDHNVFNDRLFDGDIYKLGFSYDWSRSKLEEEQVFTVNLYQVDDNFYQYRRTSSTYVSNLDIGVMTYLIAEPSQIYSNVKGGIGIVGGVSLPATASVILDLK